MESKKIIVASAPTGLRHALCHDMGSRFPERLAVKEFKVWENPHFKGVNTDYRWHVRLATEMVTLESELDMSTIYTHSILDGLVYTIMAIERHAKFDNVSEYERNKWLAVFALISFMFKDSFDPDLVIFLDIYEQEDDEYEIQQRIKMILDEFGVNYKTFNCRVESRSVFYNLVEEEIGKVLDGQRDDLSKPKA